MYQYIIPTDEKHIRYQIQKKTVLKVYIQEEIFNSLDNNQKDRLLKCMQKHEPLFDGALGKWISTNYNIELKENVNPCHTQPYELPKAYEQTLKLEVE